MRFPAARGRARNGTVTELAAAGRRPDLLAESRARQAATPNAYLNLVSGAQAPANADAFYRAWYRGHIDPYVFGGCTCGCVTK